MKKIIYVIAFILLIALGSVIYFVDSALPIGNGYTAKYLCSQVFLSGRDAGYVFEHEIKPTNALFSLIKYSVDYKDKTVTAMGLGFRKPLTAVYRDGFGCTLAIDSTRDELLKQTQGSLPRKKHNPALVWPEGEKMDIESLPPEVDKARLNKVVEDAFKEPLPKEKAQYPGSRCRLQGQDHRGKICRRLFSRDSHIGMVDDQERYQCPLWHPWSTKEA